jgi:glycosyltransferase involved in cell wall biosynthesis
MKRPELSVVIPVYNEERTICQIAKAIDEVPLDKELIFVDDGSTDGTRELLEKHFRNRQGCRIILHEKNVGKGKAIQSGIHSSTGEALIIQDADMEYDPKDYLKLVEVLNQGNTNVVYGSRFMNKKKVTSFWHRAVNAGLTQLTNGLYASKLTDMETCYKLFRSDTIKKINLESNGFEIEAELTAKLLTRGETIIEVPISYKGRSYHEGKKIGWWDGVKTVMCLLRLRFFHRVSV